MTRIIAGFAGSIALAVPGSGTRPTSDRVREAIFSALDARGLIDGARVLDLYAGSGALGLEAASRGAGHVRLVERSKQAAAVCSRNAASVLEQAPAGVAIEVSSKPVQSWLASNRDAWDIALLDPPYELGEPELTLALELLVPRLAPDAVVMLERSSRSPEPTWPSGLTRDRRNDYGDTTLWWAQPV